ncbi:hypothetical protein BC629DRAFT_672042 [Irpex lacteus]|nr:hypothetical protein BC629DRAFT_672042 [Irpex lacteus]
MELGGGFVSAKVSRRPSVRLKMLHGQTDRPGHYCNWKGRPATNTRRSGSARRKFVKKPGMASLVVPGGAWRPSWVKCYRTKGVKRRRTLHVATVAVRVTVSAQSN